ncbi:MAG TPA: nicotinate phosphoribosyltransferase [Dictyoglomaceae bacterium]|nr:nicotinate phosphoribosyltransferase [Dictyoglomaceae bacterium]HOL39993.1 nicotinate phosphoribosyltransferase [Dictyoglomaceae bacterium]HOP95219.1 nicotinate phosphoribosyltransferase [Dictyoglomaceae bacterium]HPP16583.1 nicotinate phosphoribosyltransferase [Dictyoglomaceae bacterium]HPU43751.1 nicotinate phosphoribosyltransferase [Dictyoglomaceae bacterium]
MKDFLIAKPEDIKNGLNTDAYFLRTEETLDGLKKNPYVVSELFTKSFPDPNYIFGVALGIYEIAKLLEGIPVDVYAVDEGEIFFPYEPIIQIRGKYRDFARYETSILGFVCFMSGIATKSARVRIAAKDKKIHSFGTRRQHPFLSPVVEYAAYVSGFDGVSNVLGAKYIYKTPVGTMPHALILIIGDEKEAFSAFDQYVDPKVPRIALIDTYGSPTVGAINALEALKEKLQGVRLDSKDYVYLIKDIRWEFARRGYPNVQIFLSGGLDEYEVEKYRDLVDAFGIGTKVANAPVIDFALKIVEVEGNPVAKSSNMPGAKQIQRGENFEDTVRLFTSEIIPGKKPLIKPLIRDGKIVRDFEEIDSIRKRILNNLNLLPENMRVIEGGKTYIPEFLP